MIKNKNFVMQRGVERLPIQKIKDIIQDGGRHFLKCGAVRDYDLNYLNAVLIKKLEREAIEQIKKLR